MSSLVDTYILLAGELWTGKVSDDEFYAAFSTSAIDVRSFGLRALQEAIAIQDGDLVELGLYVGHRFGFTDGYLAVLTILVGVDWHTDHENAVEGLAMLRAPSSIDTLYRTATAKFAYLDYDKAFALGVKCIWAIGSLASVEAVARLGDLLSCDNKILVENALNQLSILQDEAESQVVRDAATKVLSAREPKSGAGVTP